MKTQDVIVLALLALLGLVAYLQNSKVNPPRAIQNAETWEWIDAFGNHRSITVHRDVHAG